MIWHHPSQIQKSKETQALVQSRNPSSGQESPLCRICSQHLQKESLQQGGPCQWAQRNQAPRRALCGVMLGFSYSFFLLYVPRNPVLWEIERSPPSSSPQPLFHRLSCTTCELDKVRIHVAEKSCLCLATPLYAMTPVEWFTGIKVFTWEKDNRFWTISFIATFQMNHKSNSNSKMGIKYLVLF